MRAGALTLTAYLLGSISFALLIAKSKGIDLREEGSGNLGATNAGRALGKGLGRVVLILDMAKGALPVIAAGLLLPPEEAPWVGAVGFAAVLGHCFPIWHGLRGGKGAATGMGAIAAAVPWAGLAAALTYLLLKKLSRRASVGSLGGAAVGAGVSFALVGRGPDWPLSVMALSVALLITLRHYENIGRLIRGTEPPS